MKQKIYRKDNVCIVNFNQGYVSTPEALLSSSTFRNVVESYLDVLHQKDPTLFQYVIANQNVRVAKVEITNVLRQLLVFEVEELTSFYLEDLELLGKFVEGLYNYWKSFQRFTINSKGSFPTLGASYIDLDANFNRLIRSTYRLLDEKIKGRKNNIYRQLQAGSNAAILVRNQEVSIPGIYASLTSIPMIDSIMLRTPLILYPKSNKRVGSFKETLHNPMDQFEVTSDYLCYPAKVGNLLAYIYVHRDFIGSQVALANLFELANEEECSNPDLILLFGVPFGNGCEFYHDKETNIFVGSVSYDEHIDYFGYVKKMVLTLFNVAQMERGCLPMHGAFVSIHKRDGSTKNVMFVGDSGAGKSETIEAIKNVNHPDILEMDVIFDDMGIIGVKDQLYGQGSEIGAFIRLDDLDKGSPYKEIDRSIFMNPQTTNARVIVPAAPYKLITKEHRIDLVLYANNYDYKEGMYFFSTKEEAIQVFKEGTRMAKGTTDEVGITTTYFANPFGPQQRQAQCDVLIDQMFTRLYKDQIPVGEIYTQLGFLGDGLPRSAQQLVEWVLRNEH